jgi:hypothetical protein
MDALELQNQMKTLSKALSAFEAQHSTTFSAFAKKRHYKKMTRTQIKTAIELRKTGQSYGKISATINCPASTIQSKIGKMITAKQ